MKSNLNITEFKKRLVELTTQGKDFYFFTPYDFSGKPFCGTHDDTTFKLSRNSFWRHVIVIEIKGEYKQSDLNTTEVNCKVGLSQFIRNLTFVLVGLFFIGINIFFFFIEREPFGTIMAINLFFIFACLWGLSVNWITTKIVNQRFKKEFEIGVKDEWSNHSDSLVYKRFAKND